MYLQKIVSRLRQYITYFFSLAAVKRFIKRTTYLGTFLSLSIYVWVRLLFHDVPFEILQELGMILNLLFVGCFLTGLCIGGFNLLMYAADAYAMKANIRKAGVTVLSRATVEKKIILLQQHDLFNGAADFKIDKTGRLRYIVKMATAVEKKEKNTKAVVLENEYDKEAV
jgi:hypothetical protein